jgi:hypothetical protein
MNYWEYLGSKVRHNPFPQVVLHGLAKMRITIQPYYLFVEGLFGRTIPRYETGFNEYDLSFLGREDMKVIAAIPHRLFSEEQLLLRLEEGKLCFGATCRGEIAAFTWCDLDECHFQGYSFPLKKNEAYLFDAYTLDSFRGRGVAPFIRYQLYKELAKSGRTTLYSISERFNIPAIKFKKKLNGEIVGRGLSLELFRRWRLNSQLKRM